MDEFLMPLGFMEYCRDRLFEWVMTVIMLAMAVEIFFWPSTIRASSFHLILHVINPENMALFFAVFGLMRIAALVANGNWPVHGPQLRALGAGASAFMWGQMLAAFVELDNGGVPSPGIPVYFCFVIGELISAYRAIGNARPGS